MSTLGNPHRLDSVTTRGRLLHWCQGCQRLEGTEALVVLTSWTAIPCKGIYGAGHYNPASILIMYVRWPRFEYRKSSRALAHGRQMSGLRENRPKAKGVLNGVLETNE